MDDLEVRDLKSCIHIIYRHGTDQQPARDLYLTQRSPNFGYRLGMSLPTSHKVGLCFRNRLCAGFDAVNM
jgi:hypothetical protein